MDSEEGTEMPFLMSEADALEAMEDVQKSGPGKSISIFIVTKSLFVIYSNMRAIFEWNKSNLPMKRPVQALLMFSNFMICCTMFYKFHCIEKPIGPLFLL